MSTVMTQDEFRAAITSAESEIIIGSNISLTSPTNINYTVTIKGNADTSLFWGNPRAASRNMFIITATGNLTIEKLILDAEERDGTLIKVEGGIFTMNDGAILRNVKSTTAQKAITIGDMLTTLGGTFIMNGGLITGIDSDAAVLCSGGTIVMNNDAEISNNLATGLNLLNTITDNVRTSFTMSGRSKIANNINDYSPGGIAALGSDMVMGVNAGDTPSVTGNKSTNYGFGGIFLSDASTLIMHYESEVSDNYALYFGGGIALQNESTITMHENAAIKNNTCDGFGGGVIMATNATLDMEDQAQISGNSCVTRGGGLNIQSGAVLTMKGSSSIYSNTAEFGGGIYLNTLSSQYPGVPVATTESNSAPSIYNNTALNRGGGVFISAEAMLELTGQATIKDNSAIEGRGVYKEGTLHISQSLKILDGLFFDDLDIAMLDYSTILLDSELPSCFQINSDASNGSMIKTRTVENMIADNYIDEKSFILDYTFQQAHTSNVPIIVGTLTENAIIQLESSGYISLSNVPLVIADKSQNCPDLRETDRAAWLAPKDFSPGYSIILNTELNQVLIVLENYAITYLDLFGTINLNPITYEINDLPITLLNPGKRRGYAFKGWRDSEGRYISSIPIGTSGNISISAVWEKLVLYFDGNAPCVCYVPKEIHEENEKITIPAIIPIRRGYTFICWNTPSLGSGKTYFPGDVILLPESSITLYAQWQKNECKDMY